MSDATPRPWTTFYEGSGDHLILGADQSEVASLTRPDAHMMAQGPGAPINEANAALIVRAVNAHDELRSLLLTALDAAECNGCVALGWTEAVNALLARIDARPEPPGGDAR